MDDIWISDLRVRRSAPVPAFSESRWVCLPAHDRLPGAA